MIRSDLAFPGWGCGSRVCGEGFGVGALVRGWRLRSSEGEGSYTVDLEDLDVLEAIFAGHGMATFIGLDDLGLEGGRLVAHHNPRCTRGLNPPDDKIQPFFCIDQLNIQVL